MPKDEIELNADQVEAKAFDDAWNDDAPDTDDFEDDVDDDTSDQEAVEDDNDEDSTDELEEESDEDESDDQDEEESTETDDEAEQPTNDKDAQRLKSWEGRLRADEARLKREREALESKQKEGKQSGNESDDEQDTGNSPDEFEEEFPEVAHYLKKHIQPIQEQLSKSQLEQQQKETEAHFRRITASHPDALDVAQSDDFQTWIDNQPYKKAKEYVQVQQSGTPEQVISMLDDFKQHKSESTKSIPAKPPSSVVKTRRTAKPKGRVAKDDFDGAWEAANSK